LPAQLDDVVLIDVGVGEDYAVAANLMA